MNSFLNILLILFIAFQVILAIYLLLPSFYVLMYGIFRLFKIKTPFERKPICTKKEFEFGIIITAHQDTRFVPPLIDSILKQHHISYYVYVVADDCNREELVMPSDSRLKLLYPPLPLNSKIKSIHYAIDHFIKKHDSIIILDADNLIHPAFLSVINSYLQKGYKVVQSDFKPKNTSTNYERMDAIGDMYNFFLEREMRMRLGLSAAIWGSGVAIDNDLYNEVEYKDFLGGFDKKLQAHIMLSGNPVAFAPDAILFDEKITSGKSLEKQRTRWMSAYFKYFGESLQMLLSGLKRRNIDLFYSGFITLRPPLVMLLLGSLVVTLLNYFILPEYFVGWLLILLSFPLSFTIIVAIKGKDMRFIKTLFLLPLFAFRQVIALFKIKKARKSFLKTQHSRLVYIDDLIQK